jgi:O-methyltransferase
MKTVVILGAGQMGKSCAQLLKVEKMKLIAFGDNNQRLWKSVTFGEIPVLSVENALFLNPDVVLIGVIDEERTEELRGQAIGCGFEGEFICASQLKDYFDIRAATLQRIAKRIDEQDIPGQVAELGVYKGDTACQLNRLMPKRKLYLFDTFSGFSTFDDAYDKQRGFSDMKEGRFSDTSKEEILEKLPHVSNVTVLEGHFPETAIGLEEQFALVNIDVDIYNSTFAGLEYFYPRLSIGGMILLHDYDNKSYNGVREAVRDYEQTHGNLLMVPLADLHGSVVIVKA